VEKATVDLYVSDMAEDGLKPATIKRRISTIRSMFQYAWQTGLQANNPAKYVSTPKLAEALPKTINEDDLRKTILDSSIDINVRGFIAFIAETGCRISEALSVTKADFDLENRSLRIWGKGKKERVVYFGDITAAYVRYARTIGNIPLWTWSQRQTRFLVYNALRKHSKALQLSPHAIRHSFATDMLNSGCPITSIQTILGHKSVQTTERYAKVAQTTAASDYLKYSSNYGRTESKSA
jgi:site-specific recombinase XerD